MAEKIETINEKCKYVYPIRVYNNIVSEFFTINMFLIKIDLEQSIYVI